MYLKESCFPDCWKFSSVVPIFKNVGERFTAKNYHSVSLLSEGSRVFENLIELLKMIELLISQRNLAFFLILALGFFNQLQIF